MIRILVVLAAGTMCIGCTTEITQRVSGTLTVNGAPLKHAQVLLARGDEKKNCPPNSPVAAVDSGSFSLERPVHLGALDVIVQNDALCIKESDAWQLAWHSFYGPAPETLTFSCNKQQEKWACTANELESMK